MPEKDKKPEEEKPKDQDKNNILTENTTTVCTGQININIASAEDLDKIISVGPATAQNIIAFRPFYSLNDLLNVSGIGEATLQKITEQGCAYVEPTSIVGGGGGVISVPVLKNILISGSM